MTLIILPEIPIGNNGNKKFTRFSSDLPGTYAVVVQGITANGISGSSTALFIVQQEKQE